MNAAQSQVSTDSDGQGLLEGDEALGLSPDEIAFYDALANNLR
jgi:hypothetical protein